MVLWHGAGIGDEFKNSLQQTTLTMCSFAEVAFSFDADFLVQQFAAGKVRALAVFSPRGSHVTRLLSEEIGI